MKRRWSKWQVYLILVLLLLPTRVMNAQSDLEKNVVATIDRLVPLYQNAGRQISEYDQAADEPADTLLWSREKTVVEASGLLGELLSHRTELTGWTDLKAIIYQGRVKRWPFSLAERVDGYAMAIGVLEAFVAVYPEMQAIAEQELGTALDAQLYPHALQLLQIMLEGVVGAEELRLIQEWLPRFKGVDEEVWLQARLLEIEVEEQVLPQVRALTMADRSKDAEVVYLVDKYKAAFDTLEARLPVVHPYVKDVKRMRRPLEEHYLFSFGLLEIDMDSGAVQLELGGLIHKDLKVRRERRDTPPFKTYPARGTTIVRDTISDVIQGYGAMAYWAGDRSLFLQRAGLYIEEWRGASEVVLAFFRAKDGAPEPNLSLRQLDEQRKPMFGTFQTDKQGRVVVERGAQSYFLYLEDRRLGEDRRYFFIPKKEEPRPLADRPLVEFYTDRPLYRRGQTLKVGLITAALHDGERHLVPQEEGELSLVAYSETGERMEVAAQSFTTNHNGVAELSFEIPEDPSLGGYRLEYGRASHRVEVQDYKLSHLTIEVDSVPTGYVVGQKMRIYGRTVDLNGHPLEAELLVKYDDGAWVKGRSNAAGRFVVETNPIKEDSFSMRRYRFAPYRQYVTIEATDLLGNTAAYQMPFTKVETNLRLEADALFDTPYEKRYCKEELKLTLQHQPYHRALLGSLEQYKILVELLDDKGKEVSLGYWQPNEERTITLDLPSGYYRWRLSAIDYFGNKVEDTSEPFYLYSEKDKRFEGDELLWATELTHGVGLLIGSAYDGYLTLVLIDKERLPVYQESVRVEAHALQQWHLPDKFWKQSDEWEVQLYAFHQEERRVERFMLSNGADETEEDKPIKVLGLEGLEKAPFFPGASTHQRVQLLDEEGQPLARQAVLVTIFDKAVAEAAGGSDFWSGIASPLINDYFYYDFAVESAGGDFALTTAAPMRTMAMAQDELEKGSEVREVAITGLRQFFAETAYFSALLETDEEGVVAFDFTWPDTQTKYIVKLYTFKPDLSAEVMKEYEAEVFALISGEVTLPRYLMRGDRMQAQLLIRNATEEPRPIYYSVKVDGEVVLSSELATEAKEQVAIPFEVTTDRIEGEEVVVEVALSSGDLQDALLRKIPLRSDLSSYTVAVPLTVYGASGARLVLEKSELKSSDALLELYFSPLHAILSQMAKEYEAVKQIKSLPLFPSVHLFAVLAEMDQYLKGEPQVEQLLAEQATLLAQTDELEEMKQSNFVDRQATLYELTQLYQLLSQKEQRAMLLKSFEEKLASFTVYGGGFRYSHYHPEASPWLTVYILRQLAPAYQVFSVEFQEHLFKALGYLERVLQSERSFFRDHIEVALIRADLGRPAPAPKEVVAKEREQYQTAHTSRMLRYGEYCSIYEGSEHFAEVLQFVKDRSHYTFDDLERAELGLFISRHEKEVQPVVVQQLLQLKQGTLWESPLMLPTVKLLLKEVQPSRISDKATIDVAGQLYTLNALEQVTGHVVRTVSRLQPSTKIEWSGMESDFVFGGLRYEVTQPSKEVTLTGDKLKVSKKIFTRQMEEDGSVSFKEVTAEHPARVGETLIVRYYIETAQDLSLIKLVDARPATSDFGYHFEGIGRSDRVWWFFERREASDELFIYYLPRGEHVLELEAISAIAGDFAYGPAEVVSYYAPEFAGNSAGGSLMVLPHLTPQEPTKEEIN